MTMPAETRAADSTVYPIIAAIAVCHMLNDLMQSLIPAIYPLLKANLALSFSQIGLRCFAFRTRRAHPVSQSLTCIAATGQCVLCPVGIAQGLAEFGFGGLSGGLGITQC